MKVVALAGGTGSAKLVRGLSRLHLDLTVVANVGDNFWFYGAYVCPDVDVATYTLAGISASQGWGIAGDTFAALGALSRLGGETWFRLGDRDLATCLLRTGMIEKGSSLTEATRSIARSLGVRTAVLPVSDDRVETRVTTPAGEMHLQEFWVRERGRPRVLGVRYDGASRARPTAAVAEALSEADRIIVCPANPVTSIGPMLAVKGFRSLLSSASARIVALSPMVGTSPFSGPAAKLLRATGLRADSSGVAKLYEDFVDCIMISKEDRRLVKEVEGIGIGCTLADTRMRGARDEVRLGRELIRA